MPQGGRPPSSCTLCKKHHTVCDGQRPFCGRCVSLATSRTKFSSAGKTTSPAELCFYAFEYDDRQKLQSVLHHVLTQTACAVGNADLQERRQREQQRAAAAAQQQTKAKNGFVDPARRNHAQTMLAAAREMPAGAEAAPRKQKEHACTELELRAACIQDVVTSLNVEVLTSYAEPPTGGQGAVLCVRHKTIPHEPVALKIFKRRWQGGWTDKSHILLEYRNLSWFHGHPNIVQLGILPGCHLGLASRLREGRVEYVGLLMEWVPSVALSEAAQDKNWRQRGAVMCMTSLIGAVKFIHHRLFVHCDIKADNVLINPDCCSIKVVDAGCSVVCNVGVEEQYCTRGYNAPELLACASDSESDSSLEPKQKQVFHNAAARALDLWAVGITCLQFACGQKQLVEESEADGHGERADRQDSLLCKLSRESTQPVPGAPWTLQFAQQIQVAEDRIIESRLVFEQLDKLLSADPGSRVRAAQEWDVGELPLRIPTPPPPVIPEHE
mgnify:CR=1 FL=1